MENQTTSTKQIALTYGLILGFVSIAFAVVLYAMGKHLDGGSLNTIGSLVITIGIIVFGLRTFKIGNGGFLSLSEALKTGLAIVLIGTIISLLYTYVFMTYIEPNFMSQVMELQQQKALEANPNLTDEQLEAMETITKKFSSPMIIMAVGLVWSLFIGFVISLIAGLIMKKAPEQDY
ncbi:MAG: DUF4199 domain-containing protein [Flavobacteriales bacterium]|jgi:hypothetical protein|nr:DUF4199 domain-containing protein [Flavobacteriales bacterium]